MTVYPVAPQDNLIQRILAFLEQSQVRLLMIDDAHCLKREHLESLRMLVEKSDRPVLLIGHPGLLTRISRSFQVDVCVEDPSDAQLDKEDV
jgi:type II secretory pathway predicted ATPase ExeA